MPRQSRSWFERSSPMLRRLLLTACVLLALAASAAAQGAAPTVAGFSVEEEGAPVTDPVVLSLVRTRPGAPLDMRDVRETITHLMSLSRYEDVQIYQAADAGGVRLRYVLLPLHPVDRVEFRGHLGLPEGDLRKEVSDRIGIPNTAMRVQALLRDLQQYFRARGFTQPMLTTHTEPTHNPDRASLVVDIDSGPRAVVESVDVDDVPGAMRGELLADVPVRVGQPYDGPAIQRELDRYQAKLRERGNYLARAIHLVSFDRAGAARVSLQVDPGPHVTVAFAGDPIPENERARLVPIQSEASIDEDLLEDSSRAVEDYFKSRGYRDALVEYTRSTSGDMLTITFTVSRGARYIVDGLMVAGNRTVGSSDVLQALQLKPETPYVQASVDAGVSAVRNLYRTRGFTRVAVRGTTMQVPSPAGAAPGDRHVVVTVDVNEGPRTRVGSVTFDGATVMRPDELRQLITTAPDRPYSEADVASDRDRIDVEYRNRGYDAVAVEPRVDTSADGTRADVHFVVNEGPQAFVDQVIILGNQRTSSDTIEREIVLQPGQPLSYARLLETQQRLGALGLFRRIQVTTLVHPGDPRRDILVQVEESPPTTVGYGGGIEGGVRLRPAGDTGLAQERFEFAPRGFVEIGRRNLWGKNRSVNLFTRVSLKSRDIVLSNATTAATAPAAGSGYGLNEYRVFGTFREPRVFNSRADILFTGIADQAIRSSFNFRTRQARAEAGLRVGSRYSLAARYSFEHTKLFDEKFTDAEKPLIDRLFPQVQISKVAASVVRDSRDDVLYPSKGTFTVVDAEVAARHIGSEVGFVKTFLQGFAYLPVRGGTRTVLALGARVGAAHGFPRVVNNLVVVQDLPASERFFAGGDTTVRGFALDRLGDARTISSSGFPTGGNGEIVLNAELRVRLLNRRAEVVGFVDAGNVFPNAGDLSLTDLRPTTGFGGRYRSPVGPIRVDVGFNLDRRELVPGTRERGYVLHISLGQAF